jgi:HPr kinase/phosphorylase
MPQISVDQLFSDNQAKLSFEWAAGKGGGSQIITGDAALKPTVGLVGHMNFIHPFRVQVLGPAEFNYLKAQTAEGFAAVIDRLFTPDLAVVIVANNEPVPAYLGEQADRFNTAVFSSAQPSAHIVEVLRIYLARVLAESTTLHGVFLDVLEIGVLITGASAIGKSELALELISRGHGLIADDIVEFHRTSPETLEGRCPPILRDFLEVRGIGIINIKTIFGETAVRPRKTLRVIVHLEDHSNEKFSDLDRLQVNATFQEILGVAIRKVTIPVAAGRNLAVLVEAAVRNFVLNLRGIDSTREFIERQQRLMDEGV